MHLQPDAIKLALMEKNRQKKAETAWVLLLRSQQVLIDIVETKLKSAGFPPLSWYDLLLELDREPGRGLRQYEIGERVLLNKHNLSRLIDRLENQALVQRVACNTDGRGNVIKITEKGVHMRKAMWPIYEQAIQEVIANPLTVKQIDSLTDIMGALLNRHIDV